MKAEWTNNDSLTISQTTKAVLVFDMPKDCASGCPVMCLTRGINHRPTWCPLKPLPQNKQHEEEIDYDYGYIDGWNECLDEIMGKDCRGCVHWGTCVNGKEGHEKGTSQGYSIGECQYFEKG